MREARLIGKRETDELETAMQDPADELLTEIPSNMVLVAPRRPLSGRLLYVVKKGYSLHVAIGEMQRIADTFRCEVRTLWNYLELIVTPDTTVEELHEQWQKHWKRKGVAEISRRALKGHRKKEKKRRLKAEKKYRRVSLSRG